MRRIKLISVILVIAMMVPALTSCKSGKKGSNVVKADDPWYETTRFKLEKNLTPTDQEADTVLCTSGDRLYFAYCYSGDKWATTTTILDTYDFDGNLISSCKLTCPALDGFHISRIYSLSSDPDGKTISAILYYNSASSRGHAFAKIDIETGTVSDIKDAFSGEAAKSSGSAVYGITSIGDYQVAVLDSSNSAFADYSLYLYKNTEFVAVLDMSTISLRYLFDGFSTDVSSDSLYAVGCEETGIITMEFDLRNGKLKNKSAWASSDDNKVNFAEFIATDKGDLCKIDSFGNISMVDFSTMTSKTIIDTNWYAPRYTMVETDERYYHSQIVSCSEERTVILDSETTMYGMIGYKTEQYARVLTKSDKNPHAGKEIIELSLPLDTGLTEYLAQSIYAFNETDDKYLIRLWDNYKSGFNVGRSLSIIDVDDEKMYQMIQDLKGDEAPDLAIGIQNNYAMRDDVFMDLSDFLEPEVYEKQYANIIEAGRIDGKLYFLPVTLEIEGLVTNKDLIGNDAVGITFEDFDRLIEEDMYGYSPYDYPFSNYYNKLSFFLSCIDTKSAIDGQSVEFGTEQFRAAAEYARANFAYDDASSMPENDYMKEIYRNRGECYYSKIADFLDFVHACYREKGHYVIIGTPSVDASGPRFKAIETISVSATTDVPDGCKKFINFLYSGSAFASGDCEFWQIVTNREIMSKNVDTLFLRNNEEEDLLIKSKESGAVMDTAGSEKAYGDKYATEDMCESFLNSLSSISTYYYEDKKIVQFVSEELAPYYAGDRSLDDVILYLNDRTAKYVREM